MQLSTDSNYGAVKNFTQNKHHIFIQLSSTRTVRKWKTQKLLEHYKFRAVNELIVCKYLEIQIVNYGS